MSLVMALPAGQEADHPHHHQQPGAVDSRLFKGPNALFNQRASGKAVPKHDHTQRSFLIMFPAWLFGMAVFATQILWQRSEIGLLQFSNLPDTSDGEAVVISSSAVSALLLFYLLGLLTFYVTPSFFRPDDKTVWSAASAGFGAASFSGDKLPSWADEIVHAVGGARAIMPGLAVAYAFGSLVYLFLVGTTSIVAELAGPDFMHKHHHIYRPMILKAWVSWMAYNVGICIAALMVPWTMEAALDSYNDENNTKVKMEICAGISMLLIALFLHLIALTTGFHLIAKQRMQLRHPGWVVAVHEHRKKQAHELKKKQKADSLAAQSHAQFGGSDETLVGNGSMDDKHSMGGSYQGHPGGASGSQQSFGDQPYGANDGYNQQQIPPPQYPTHQQPPYVDSASVPVPQQGQAPNVQGMAYGDGVPYYQQPPQQQGGSMNPYGEAAQYFNQQRGYAGPAETGNQGNPSAYEGSMYPEPPQGAEPQGSVYPLKKKSYRHKRRPDPKVDVEAGDASVSANPFQEHRN